MSVRYLAQALYESLKRLDELKARLASAGPAEKADLTLEINRAEAEAARLRRLLDAKKSG